MIPPTFILETFDPDLISLLTNLFTNLGVFDLFGSKWIIRNWRFTSSRGSYTFEFQQVVTYG